MTEVNKDVVVPSSGADADTKVVDTKVDAGDDKLSNLAALRKIKESQEAEIAALKKALDEKNAGGDRTLSIEDEEKQKAKKNDTLKVLFDRDLKEATLQWTSNNKVTNEEWAEIRSKISLKGEETISEIKNKINEAYLVLPTVIARREEEIRNKAKKDAMKQFRDNDMDLGGGADTVDYGNNDGSVQVSTKEKNFLKAFGVTPDEVKKISKDANTNEWTDGPTPTRKFFDGAKS